ncbi:unnamed protein product [Rhizophagus irregularis]|nr:unnamed protein product [Rhizophagus irregularis]
MDELIFKFTAEVAAVYCRLDCGGGTLDLTTRKLVGNNPLQLSEVTERSSGGFCGSAFVDKEFIAFT